MHFCDEDCCDDEASDFECSECGEEIGDDDVCTNEECEMFDHPISGGLSDSQLRAWERRQMGITS